MKRSSFVPILFFTGFAVAMIGAIQKILRNPAAETWMTVGFILTLIFILAATVEVQRSRTASRSEKTMWTLGFIFFSGIAGLVYLLSARKRIATTS